ncbi:MAG: hypothetical protein K1X55_18060, partial [Chitinophagales bacterium]|nr:hypothetical protein [Chitinophagales bacterium]
MINHINKILVVTAILLTTHQQMIAGEGPVQPEVKSFTPVSSSDMVDPYSGDFKYNIPLFTLPGPDGGYPVNLAYSSGIS